MKIALTADLQYDSYQSLSTILPSGITSRLQDQLDALSWVADDALKRGCTQLLSLGDIFDSRVELDLAVIDRVCRAYYEIATRGLELTFLVGNHDAYLRNAGLNSLQMFRGYANVIDTPQVIGPFAFLPWVDDCSTVRDAVDGLAKDKQAKFLFMHGIIQGAVHNSVKGIELEAVNPKRWKQVFLGDVHTPTQMAPNVHYVGALMQLEFGDAASFRGYVVLDTETGKFERIENTISPQFHILGGRNKSYRPLTAKDFVSVEIDDPVIAAEITADARKKAGWVRTCSVEVPDTAPRLDVRVTQGVADVLRKYCDYQGLAANEELLALGVSFVQSGGSLFANGGASAGLVIGQTDGENFGPFEKISFDFSQPGLTTLEGRIDGVQGCDGNGSGKSFAMDLPVWTLFGRCLRPNYAGDEIIRHEAKYAYGRVEIKGGESSVVVERYRKHPQYKDMIRLFVGGADVTRGTNQQTQEAIEAVLGVDFLAAVNSVAYGTREDVRSFFSSTDSDRKAVLEKIFGLEMYTDAWECAQNAVKAANTTLSEGEAKVAEYERNHFACVQVLEAVTQVDEDEHRQQLEDAELAVAQAKFRLLKAKRAAKKDADAIKKATSDALVAKLQFKIVRAKYEEDMKKYKEVHDKLNSEHVYVTVEARRCERGAEQSKEIEEAATELRGTKCPTCSQEVAHEHSEGVIKKASSDRVKFEKELKRYRVEIEKTKAALEAHKQPPEPVDTESQRIAQVLELAQQSLKEHNAVIQQVDREVSLATRAFKDLEQQKNYRDAAQEDVNAALSALEKAKVEIEADKLYADKCRFWVDAFGNKGLKSFLLEAEIPEVNRRASVYAQRMLGSGALVRLSATKTLKTKGLQREEITVEGIVPGLTKSYAGASKGQKRRMDLALLLAFRDIIAARSSRSFKQLFADELFDGVDKAGCETVVSLLKEIAKECPVLLVTHDPRLKSAGDRSVLIHHNGTTAQLVAHGATATTTNSRKLKNKS